MHVRTLGSSASGAVQVLQGEDTVLAGQRIVPTLHLRASTRAWASAGAPKRLAALWRIMGHARGAQLEVASAFAAARSWWGLGFEAVAVDVDPLTSRARLRMRCEVPRLGWLGRLIWLWRASRRLRAARDPLGRRPAAGAASVAIFDMDSLRSALHRMGGQEGSFLRTLDPEALSFLAREGALVDLPAGAVLEVGGAGEQGWLVLLDGQFEERAPTSEGSLAGLEDSLAGPTEAMSPDSVVGLSALSGVSSEPQRILSALTRGRVLIMPTTLLSTADPTGLRSLLGAAVGYLAEANRPAAPEGVAAPGVHP